jgi:hypothetical protein
MQAFPEDMPDEEALAYMGRLQTVSNVMVPAESRFA